MEISFEPNFSLVERWVSVFILCHKLAGLVKKRLSNPSGAFKPLRILHLSDNFIVINKDPDVLINSNDPEVKTSLHVSLCHEFPGLANPSLRHSFHFVHRLDYVTSGVIVVGLSKKASSAAAAAFENRLASKFYVALLRGHVSAELLEINLPIGELKSEMTGSHRMTVVNDQGTCVNPRPATTRLLVLERGIYGGYPATKVILKPITGRRHQLRVHCAHIGHTIVGDFTYSCRKDINPERTFLHALRLTLPNLVESLDIQTSDPFRSIKAWTLVEKFNDIGDSTFLRLQTSPAVNKSILKIS
uniref:RNA pseudouridylate synthase domain-containing protein 1 n=1 Tax=Lygus hesperus TaxID=30085 RepID=A0A146LKN6_LYGHE